MIYLFIVTGDNMTIMKCESNIDTEQAKDFAILSKY